MRNPIIYLVVLAALGLVACEQQVDVAAEEAAIKAVCQAQLDAFRAFDYEGEAATWAHEPYIVIRKSGNKVIGWDSLSVWYKSNFEKRRELMKNEPGNYTRREFSGSNYEIHLNGNAAYIFYDQHSAGIWEGEEFSNDSKVAKYLEKIDGEWKIVAVF